MPDEKTHYFPEVLQAEQTWFRPDEAANYMRIGRTTLYSLLRDGTVPSVAIGRIRLIRRRDLDAYLDEQFETAKGSDG